MYKLQLWVPALAITIAQEEQTRNRFWRVISDPNEWIVYEKIYPFG